MNPWGTWNAKSGAIWEAGEVDGLDVNFLVVLILNLNRSNLSKTCWDAELTLIYHLLNISAHSMRVPLDRLLLFSRLYRDKIKKLNLNLNIAVFDSPQIINHPSENAFFYNNEFLVIYINN